MPTSDTTTPDPYVEVYNDYGTRCISLSFHNLDPPQSRLLMAAIADLVLMDEDASDRVDQHFDQPLEEGDAGSGIRVGRFYFYKKVDNTVSVEFKGGGWRHHIHRFRFLGQAVAKLNSWKFSMVTI